MKKQMAMRPCPFCDKDFEFDSNEESVTCPHCGRKIEVNWDCFPDGDGGSVYGFELREPDDDKGENS
jgi:DNA-directed RNA polymerase subunit RPC12/RpoP